MSVWSAVAGSRGPAERQAERGPGESDSWRWDPTSTTDQACEEAIVFTFQGLCFLLGEMGDGNEHSQSREKWGAVV